MIAALQVTINATKMSPSFLFRSSILSCNRIIHTIVKLCIYFYLWNAQLYQRFVELAVHCFTMDIQSVQHAQFLSLAFAWSFIWELIVLVSLHVVSFFKSNMTFPVKLVNMESCVFKIIWFYNSTCENCKRCRIL